MHTFTKIVSVMLIFAVGIFAGFFVASQNTQATDWQDTPESALTGNLAALNPFPTTTARENPMDRVPEKAIAVYRDRIILDIKDAQWATFTDTHSMEPILFAGANAIEIVPTSENDIKVGDIVSYKSEYAKGNIIHRVVYKGTDEQGTYYIMKGDNLPTSDPGRVRFSQMQRVVIAIIY